MRWWVDTSPSPLKRLSQFLYDPLTAMFFSPDPLFRPSIFNATQWIAQV